MDAQIKIDHVTKVFKGQGQDVVALKDIAFDIPKGQFVCLLGPSGCGKSTLLNGIAGFSEPSEGTIVVDNRIITEPGPDRGMVFQEYALFPWMTVEENIVFGLKIRKESKDKIRKKLYELLDMLKLADFKDRFPKDLSGGMRQRVAIARVLALDSQIMLMDEPFGALDSLTRRNLQDELLKIWSQFKKTIVFVTHSIEESIYLADRIIVMSYRPGTVKRDVTVDLPRPRNPASPEFNDLKKEISQLVMAEQARFEEAQLGVTGD